MKVLIAHPGRQHSHQLALALAARDSLTGYLTGVPAADPSTKGPLYWIIAELSPKPTLDLPAGIVEHNYVLPLVKRTTKWMLSASALISIQHRALAWFDTWVARRLPTDIDAVVAYENSAHETFEVARKRGITTILDAASFHHAWQDAFHDPIESPSAHRRIVARKNEEINLADHILTVSSFARDSYLDAGVEDDDVTSVPMGADLSDFTPPDRGSVDRSDQFTFIFAGYFGDRKGADILLEASELVAAQSANNHEVWFAGGIDARFFQDSNAPYKRLGALDRSALVNAFHRADCLVLPSRHDSFGRVVVEAMATGLPAIVSNHVGAKEAIQEGETGWTVPAGKVEPLAKRMEWCIEHPEQVRSMQDAVIGTAQQYSWEAYRKRVNDVITSVVEG